MKPKTVLAIDPGTSKCGMALVTRSPEMKVSLQWRDIVPVAAVVPKLHEAYATEPYELIVIGGGTNSQAVVQMVRQHLGSMAIIVIEEKDTTMQARERYWEFHRRRGWRRLLPATLQIPPEPVDDFAALILAERVLLASA